MKKILTILPVAALAFTGCVSSSDDSTTTAPKNLPTDYIITQMGEYSYTEDGRLEITKATCTDRANEAVWTKVNQQGSLTDVKDGKAQIDLGDGRGKLAYDFKPLVDELYPNALYYNSAALGNPLIEGVVLESPNYYSDVAYINTNCIFQNFGEMQETLAEIAKVPKSSITMDCRKLSISGLEMTYTSHTESSIDYTLSYGGISCPVKQKFLYAFDQEDCALAFKNYQKEYENGETQDFFNFELHDQDINACSDFVDLIVNFHNATGLAKSGSTSAFTEKQVKDILRAVGSRLRGRK
ncbi:MAG: hypothetical protein II565_11200 [Fibrobacter sp.]|nr:hypothetical protein [Fibrobacter sp.]